MKLVKIILLILVLGFSGHLYREFSAPGTSEEKERFVVKLGTEEEEVVDRLKEEGYLRNKTLFYLSLNYLCLQKKTCLESGKRLEPGGYLVSKDMNAYQLAEAMLFGAYEKWVLVPPGKRKEQVALILKKSLGWSEETTSNFIKVAEEGYLYPDTYLIEVQAKPEQVVRKFKNNFNEKFDLNLQKALLKANVRNDTAIKIASLIERESGGDEDKPLISQIIFNRLEEEMRLQIDATVQYALASSKLAEENVKLEEFNFWEILPSGTVRKINSPYNTYLIDGLPPGPICSPSIESIKAVAYPKETEALYYLHSKDKKIHTAITYEEHQENIKEFLR